MHLTTEPRNKGNVIDVKEEIDNSAILVGSKLESRSTRKCET